LLDGVSHIIHRDVTMDGRIPHPAEGPGKEMRQRLALPAIGAIGAQGAGILVKSRPHESRTDPF
jgi:hypothetical protein